jgi:intein/homing endonuclease
MNKDIHSISTKVLSKDNKEGTAVQWIYRGISNIQETITENGRLLKSTKEHRVLVLENGELIWKEAGCLKQGDNLCVNTASYTKKTKLELNLPVWEDKKHATCTKKLKAPQYMTPELAYLLGLIVSEGSHSCRISFSNSRIELLDKYARLMLDVFGLQTKRESSSKKGDPYVIKGISGICNVDSYCEEVESIVLAFWLKYLGLYTDQSIDGKFPSYYKIIPWCILQADEESQLAYLAAYLEGDGTLASKKGITFYSASRTNLRMIQALLGSHGILSRVLENYPVVSLDIRSSSLLYEKIKKYLISKTSIPSFIESKIHKNGTYGGRKFGLPTERLRIFLKSRKQKTTGLGAWFINDNGESIFIEKWGVIDRSSWQYLLYESYQKGNYFKFLEALKQISKVEYGRTIKLLELRYFYDKVKTIKEGEKQTVYDLTMDKVDEPAFIAEGIVVHNSGDATYNCCTGDSLIPTEHGLLRIDEIAKGHEGAIKDIDLMVGSKQGKAKAVKWLNNGIQDTLKITDECGHSLSCTPKHAFLVLKNNELIWVEAKDLKIDDIVCINTKPLVRKELLKLNLSYKESNGNRPRGDIYTPEYMTPELAFILGCLVAEGSIKEKADVIFYNSNEKLIEKYSEYIEEVFGLQTVKWINTPKGARRVIKGKETFATTDCYQVLTCHQTLVDWLIELGLCGWHKKPQDKIIPWSILQADEQSQLAFLAAYLDGDGTIGGNIQYFSSSEVLINQLQALLNIHGIPSVRAQRKTVISLSIGNIDSFKLWNLIKQYMITKNFTKTYTSEIRKGKGLGIPTESIKEFLNSRKVKSNRMGMVFKNDGEVEIIFKNAGRIFHLADLEKFSYDSYDLEKYDKFLEYLKQISEIEYDKLIELFNLRYRFTKIVNCEDNGKQKVYDLSMSKENEPVYVSCCFQTHNTMEISLSVFIENLRTFRDNLVSRIFYEKMFPILAEIHGFRKRTQAELAHRIRIEGKTVDSSLIIPQFNFHKQLRPEADTAYLEVLSTMEEKGIPVPLRTWAAAGGLNLEKIFDMKDEDIENRKSVQEWKDKVEKEAGGGETGVGKEGGGGEAPPPEKGGAWGSLINAHAEAIKKSLDSLPIWINNRFCGTSKDKFISIFKANNPSKKLMALYRNKSKQLETANYVLHRMGMNQLPFNVSATQDVASFLKRCASFYTPRKIAGEFTFLNKIIREGQIFQKSKHYNKKLETMLPSSMNEHLYSGIV